MLVEWAPGLIFNKSRPPSNIKIVEIEYVSYFGVHRYPDWMTTCWRCGGRRYMNGRVGLSFDENPQAFIRPIMTRPTSVKSISYRIFSLVVNFPILFRANDSFRSCSRSLNRPLIALYFIVVRMNRWNFARRSFSKSICGLDWASRTTKGNSRYAHVSLASREGLIWGTLWIICSFIGDYLVFLLDSYWIWNTFSFECIRLKAVRTIGTGWFSVAGIFLTIRSLVTRHHFVLSRFSVIYGIIWVAVAINQRFLTLWRIAGMLKINIIKSKDVYK